MSHRRLVVLAALFTGSLAWPSARADEPRLGPAFVEGLEAELLSGDQDIRAAAEADLSRATPELLQALVRRLRDRIAPLTPAPPAAASDRFSQLEVSLLDVEPELAARWRDAGAPRAGWRTLDAEQARRLLAEARTSGVVASQPAMRLLEGQDATMNLQKETNYVADCDVEIGMGGPRCAAPILRSVRTGTRIGVRAYSPAPRRSVRLELDVAVTGLVDPIRVEEVVIDGQYPVAERTARIEFPELFGASLRVSLPALPAGTPVLVYGARGFAVEGGKVRMFLLTATPIPASGK